MAELADSVNPEIALAYRRGLVLTGDREGAAAVLRGVLIRHDDIAGVGESLLARSAVQEARAWPSRGSSGSVGRAAGAAPGLSGPGLQLWQAVEQLPGQQREAWAFLELEGLSDIESARAMDCSRTALRDVHLAGARAALGGLLGGSYDAGLESVRSWLGGQDASGALAGIRSELRAAARKRRMWRAVMFAVFAACCAMLWWVLLDLQEANRQEVAREKLLRELEDQYSLPLRKPEESEGIDLDPEQYPIHGPAPRPREPDADDPATER